MNLTIKVITNAKQTEVVEEKNNHLKIKLKATPVKGKANAELIKLLSKKYKISKSKIEIIKGLTSKEKLIRINN